LVPWVFPIMSAGRKIFSTDVFDVEKTEGDYKEK
jgi:hypothetical protein